jgi:phosphatidylglycerophosphate synthase
VRDDALWGGVVRTIRFGQMALLTVLTVLAGTVGLGLAGWAVGIAFGLTTSALLAGAMHRADRPALGPADRVTLARAILVGGIAALVADSFSRPASVGALVGLAAVALVLDAVDGRVARRTGTVSALGARFDMEVDAFLILVLSVDAARSVGAWVLAIGVARYAYVAAGRVAPWLREPVPPRYWGKCVAAVQGVVLTVAVAGVLPVLVTDAVLLVALVLLAESFGRDVRVLWCRHRVARVPVLVCAPRLERVPAG